MGNEVQTNDAVHNLILSELKEIKDNVSDVEKKVDGLQNRIFIGNGQTSLVDRINKNTMVTKVVVWCVGVLYVAVVSGIVSIVIK